MNQLLTIIIVLITSLLIQAQSEFENRCPYKVIPVTDSRIIKDAGDFTITTTDGITRNLYNTLDSGKTVFIDLFYTTCGYCQLYAPVIEEIYLNTGAGQEDIVFWGISNNLFDPDEVIDQYRVNYNITNPCAGPNGGGTTAHTTVISGQNFQGWPTYVVICPDRTLFFDPCYPPTVTGFDPYFEQCAETIGIDDNSLSAHKFGLISVYPNPASTEIKLEVILKDAGSFMIEVTNLLGSAVFSSSFEAASARQTIIIPVTALTNGAYFLRLIQKELLLDARKVLISR